MKDLFLHAASPYEPDPTVLAPLWQELEKQYSQKKRHYHTLAHIENLLRLATDYSAMVQDWETFVFAIFYHDAVYNVLRSDNEEKSALLAEKRLTQMGFPAHRIAACQTLILATKTHAASANTDANLLMDADLSVLGADWDTYSAYAAQVRREYSIYPDLVYRPGRRKVLSKFLERDCIFKTPDFRSRLEAQARENIQLEISLLQ